MPRAYYNGSMAGIKKRGLVGAFVIVFNISRFVFCSEVSFLDLEPIVVSKSLDPSYSIESDEIKDFLPGSLIEALTLTPLDLQSRSLKGGIQTDFSLRGSNFQGVLMLINGQRVNDPQTGHYNSDIPFTTADIEKIEVIPGVNSSIFGPDAIGGAINFRLKKPKDKERVVEFRAGQNQTTRELLSISERKDNLAVRFSLENEESAGFRDDTDFNNFTTSTNSIFDSGLGELNLSMGYQEKEFGAYDFYTPASGYLSKEWTKTFLGSTGMVIDRDGFSVKPNFLWRRHYDKFMLDKTGVRSKYLNHHRTDVLTPSIYVHRETSIGKLGIGLECGEERINSSNLGKHSRNHRSIFVDENLDIVSDLNLGASLRQDDFEDLDSMLTAALTLRKNFSQRDSIHAGIARSFRLPTFTELYYSDPTTVGNAGLSAEKSLTYQAGYDYSHKNLSAGFTLFSRYEKDSIDWIKRTAAQEKWQVENISNAEVFGIENYLKLRINETLSWESNYSYIDKRMNSHGYLYKYGPNYIRHLVNNRLLFNSVFGIQEIGMSYKKKPGRDGWFLLDGCFSYSINKNSRIFLSISNILNVEYQEIAGIPQPGREITVGVRFEW